MPYTLWSRGRLIGQTELAYARSFPGLRAGDFEPSALGETLMPIIIGVGVPLIVADIAQCLTNAVLFAGVMRFANGIPMRAQIGKLLSTTGLAYIGYGIIGFLFVGLWIPARVGPFSALLVLAQTTFRRRDIG